MSATPDNAGDYCRPLWQMIVQRICLGWPKPQSRPHDGPLVKLWVEITAVVLAVGVALLAVCR